MTLPVPPRKKWWLFLYSCVRIWRLIHTNHNLDFKLSPCSECFMLSSGQFPSVWILYVDISEHYRQVGVEWLGMRNVGVFIREKVWLENSLSQNFSRTNTPTFLKPSHSSRLPAYEDGTECSETSAYKIQTPGNYQEENMQHTEHSESLKPRMCNTYCFSTTTVGMRTRLIVTCVCVCVHCLSCLFWILNVNCRFWWSLNSALNMWDECLWLLQWHRCMIQRGVGCTVMLYHQWCVLCDDPPWLLLHHPPAVQWYRRWMMMVVMWLVI